MKRPFFRKSPANGFATATALMRSVEASATDFLTVIRPSLMGTQRGRELAAKSLADIEPLAEATAAAQKRLEAVVMALQALQGKVGA